MTIVLCPTENYELVRWSLTPEVPEGNVNYKNRPTYFIYHGRGITFERFEVTLDLRRKVSDGTESTIRGALDITFSGFWLHGDEMKSQQMKDIISRFPDWTYGLGFSAATHIYSIP
jgi:hypothetical protein